MSRDSIIDEATEASEKEAADTDSSTDDEEAGRTRITQRIPDDLLDDVERVQEKHHLPSRNAAVNFMLNAAADEFLDDRDE